MSSQPQDPQPGGWEQDTATSKAITELGNKGFPPQGRAKIPKKGFPRTATRAGDKQEPGQALVFQHSGQESTSARNCSKASSRAPPGEPCLLASPLLKVTNESPNPPCWGLAQVQWMKRRQQEQAAWGCDQSELRLCLQPPSRALHNVPAPGNKHHGWRSEPGSGFYIQEAFTITGQAEASASALLVVEEAVRTGLAATCSSFHFPKHLSQPPCPHSRGFPAAHQTLLQPACSPC